MSLIQKMLAIAGRDKNGKARAIATNEKGEVLTQVTGSNVELYTWNEVLPGHQENFIYSPAIDTTSFSYLELKVRYSVMFFMKIEWYINDEWVDGESFQGCGTLIKKIQTLSNSCRIGILPVTGYQDMTKIFNLKLEGTNIG